MAEVPRAPFRSVGIVGLGVMGGSLAKALRAAKDPPEIVGWALHEGDLDAAVAEGAVTQRADSAQGVADRVELLVLATPVSVTCDLMAVVAPHLGPEALVHDVASLKEPVRRAAEKAGLGNRWVGGHPMAGSEASGWAGARGDLYSGARVWLTGSDESAAARERVSSLWQSLGALPAVTKAAEHDERMALVSHLPQLTANLLASVLADAGVHPSNLGPGGRDTTRLAESGADMWLEILAFASPKLTEALRELAERAEDLAYQLESKEQAGVRSLLERSRAWRSGA